jgi:hypothetical protein
MQNTLPLGMATSIFFSSKLLTGSATVAAGAGSISCKVKSLNASISDSSSTKIAIGYIRFIDKCHSLYPYIYFIPFQ